MGSEKTMSNKSFQLNLNFDLKHGSSARKQDISVLQERPEEEEFSPHKDNRSPGKASQKSEPKSATLKQPERPKIELKSALFPPPEDIYRTKVKKNEDFTVNYGLNMYFKKAHRFSEDPEQAGGDLAPNQPFLSMPWGTNGCPPNKQVNITDYVRKNMKDIVFCRYGIEYLRSFPRMDDLAIGSYRINLDYLIFQRQRQVGDTDNNASLVGMSFLKTKGQIENNR